MDKITRALQKTSDTKCLFLGERTIERTPEMFRMLFPGRKAIVVADSNTWAVAGKKVDSLLRQEGLCSVPAFLYDDPELFAEWSYLEQLENALSTVDAIAVAVGAGVINDLTKLASWHLGRKYMIVGTAASMDGYTAYGASVTYKGNKQTFTCPAPLGMIMDPVIASAAPEGLSASGYADMIAKVPAGVDWMLAQAVGVEPIDHFSYELVQDGLKEMLAQSAEIAARDVPAHEKLAEGLIMSGFAMQALHTSRPASGTEHQFSHYWDMEGLCYQGKHVSHGFKVGIGTLISTACLEFLLSQDITGLDADLCSQAWPTWEEMEKTIGQIFASKPFHAARALSESRAKFSSKEEVAAQIRSLQAVWPKLKMEIRDQLFSFQQVRNHLIAVGAPYEPEMIGVSRAKLKETFEGIPYMRSRFTGIDVLHRCGLLQAASDYLFGKGGKWEIPE